MNRYRIVRQEIDEKGGIHFFNEDGDEIYPAVYPVHKQRWIALTIWIAIFSTVAVLGYHQNRQAISELHRQKAAVSSLATTNAALKSFLLQACVARLNSASHETGQKKAQDIASAEGYKDLAVLFKGPDNPKCNVPKRGS